MLTEEKIAAANAEVIERLQKAHVFLTSAGIVYPPMEVFERAWKAMEDVL